MNLKPIKNGNQRENLKVRSKWLKKGWKITQSPKYYAWICLKGWIQKGFEMIKK